MGGETFLEEARGLNEAVAVLCSAPREATLYSIGILAGHCLELTLKAYLLHAGSDEGELRRCIGHDLGKAWDRCKKTGLSLGELPYWVQVLDYSHDHPYYFRYPRENRKVGVPSIDDLPRDIDSVLSLVSSAMGTSRNPAS